MPYTLPTANVSLDRPVDALSKCELFSLTTERPEEIKLTCRETVLKPKVGPVKGCQFDVPSRL